MGHAPLVGRLPHAVCLDLRLARHLAGGGAIALRRKRRTRCEPPGDERRSAGASRRASPQAGAARGGGGLAQSGAALRCRLVGTSGTRLRSRGRARRSRTGRTISSSLADSESHRSRSGLGLLATSTFVSRFPIFIVSPFSRVPRPVTEASMASFPSLPKLLPCAGPDSSGLPRFLILLAL